MKVSKMIMGMLSAMLLMVASLQAFEWGLPAINASPLEENDGNLSIAIDNNTGDAIAIWVNFNDGNKVYGARLPYGTNVWIPTTIVSSLSDDTAVQPKLGIDSSGNATAVWVNDTGGSYYLYAAKLPAGSYTWGAELQVNSLPNSPLIEATFAANGDIAVVYEDFPLVSTLVYAASTDSWTSYILTSSLGFPPGVSSPKVALDESHNAYYLWKNQVGISTDSLEDCSLNIITTVLSPVSVLTTGTGTTNYSRFKIAFNANGNGLIAYTIYDSFVNQWQIGYAYYPPPPGIPAWTLGTSFPSSVAVTSIALGIDSTGNGLLAAENSEVRVYSYNLAANTWAGPTSISGAYPAATQPILAETPSGDAACIWININLSSQYGIIGTIFNGTTGSWTAPVLLSSYFTPGNDYMDTGLGKNNRGDFIAAWNFADNGSLNANVQTTWLQVRSPSSFVGVAKKNRFGTQTEISNKLTWTPSTDPSVIGYRIYNGLNQLLVDIVNPAVDTYTFHNRIPYVTYTYKLVAYNAIGAEATPLYVNVTSN